eukprot:SAG31_NODE_44776_length_261_cov_0.876543_1_plen_32_part_01
MDTGTCDPLLKLADRVEIRRCHQRAAGVRALV